MVYIDSYNAPFGRMKMCHMVADTTEELLQMVDKIGVDRKWIQYPGTNKEHFDICLSKKKDAIKSGAIEMDSIKLARWTIGRANNNTKLNPEIPLSQKTDAQAVICKYCKGWILVGDPDRERSKADKKELADLASQGHDITIVHVDEIRSGRLSICSCGQLDLFK